MKQTPETLALLRQAVPGQTYSVADDERAVGGKSITCLVCGMTSYNANDVAQKYCANCHQWHDFLALELELRQPPIEEIFLEPLPDGRQVCILPLLFGGGRVGIGLAGDDDFSDFWDYDRYSCALIYAQNWRPEVEPEPQGWTRHAASGRRRPQGDPKQEYIHF